MIYLRLSLHGGYDPRRLTPNRVRAVFQYRREPVIFPLSPARTRSGTPVSQKTAWNRGTSNTSPPRRATAEQNVPISLKIENSDYCFTGTSREIIGPSNGAGDGSVIEKFDAYGDRLPNQAPGPIGHAQTRSTALSRIGQTIFWAVVIAVVLARVLHSPATLTFGNQETHTPAGTAAR